MGNIPVPTDLVGCIDDDHTLAEVVGQNPGDLAQHRRLAHAGAAQEEDALARLHDVMDDADGAENCPTDAQRQTDDQSGTVADGGDTMQGALDTGAVVLAERANARDDELDVLK